MPFSFKPDVTPTDAQAAPVAPPAVFGASPNNSTTITTENLMERAKTQGKTFFEIVLYTVFAFLILILAGLYGYKLYLSSQVDAKKAVLASYDAQLEGMPLEEMRKLSSRLKVISQLVKEHPSVNVAFLIIEASVENMITFSKFDLHYSEGSKTYQLGLTGLAPDYRSIALQMDTYKRKPYSTYLSKILVEGLHPDPTGQIAFSFTMPVSIAGVIPETFSLIEGAAEGAALLNQSNETATSTLATTTPAGSAGTASTTAPTRSTGTASTTVQALKP